MNTSEIEKARTLVQSTAKHLATAEAELLTYEHCTRLREESWINLRELELTARANHEIAVQTAMRVVGLVN